MAEEPQDPDQDSTTESPADPSSSDGGVAPTGQPAAGGSSPAPDGGAPAAAPARPVFNDRYELHARIARGGMADVFLARDLLLDRPVAVKVLFPQFASDAAFVERFRREAQAAANLNHPNIVAVYDWGTDKGAYFIVMEYVEGRSLADILKSEGILHPDRAADVATDVAAALSFAHRNGVVHRDVKPGNVLISSTGQIKVADFGIARAVGGGRTDDLTKTGSVLGTATYFSPEQAQGQTVDPRSDLYSLGIVLYESVSGRPPFAGDNPVAIAYQHVQEQPPPLRLINPAVPPTLEAIVLKLLNKRPFDRYPSAEDLRTDLRRFREGTAVAVVPPGAAIAPGGAPPQGFDATTAMPVVQHPEPAPAPVPDEEFEPPRRTGIFLVVLFLLLVVLVGLIIVLAQGFADNGDEDTEPEVGQVEVPNLVGLEYTQAETQLRDMGLFSEAVFEQNEVFDQDQVFQTDPRDGASIDEGGLVTLMVSAGDDVVLIPDVTQMQEADARLRLESEGFEVIVRREASDTVDEGEVMEMNPSPGQEAPEGTLITLVVSSGAEAAEIPDLEGASVSAASSELARLGFIVAEREEPSETVEEGFVLGTDPPALTSLAPGETVTILISTGIAEEEVPFVIELTQATAESTLQARGFIPVVRNEPLPFGDPGHLKVVKQEPAGGTVLPVGSDVVVYVGVADPNPPTTTTTTTTPPTTTSTTTDGG
ncbi:MAG: Stk1 family PASTA domain-containing Ser/Thr kinase [Actinomycetia bacterium]|nr:Stk1 family PASTA domain-containing Ser/Thr kinase [Actinomycetes bacterium]